MTSEAPQQETTPDTAKNIPSAPLGSARVLGSVGNRALRARHARHAVVHDPRPAKPHRGLCFMIGFLAGVLVTGALFVKSTQCDRICNLVRAYQ